MAGGSERLDYVIAADQRNRVLVGAHLGVHL
jgi:hypothetical protein